MTHENIFEQLGEILKPEPELLQHLQGKAISAHRNTSFSPERRGEQMIKEYSEELQSDMEELKAENIPDEIISDYKSRYEKYFRSYLGAKSNCFSVMITGGSNFPVRRHEKANRSEERHYTIFREWRIRAKKAICRKAKPPKTFLSEMDRCKAELESMKVNHEKMKEGNKRIAAARKTGEDITEYLRTEFNIAPHMIEWSLKFGFGLANNSANMRRVEERIKLMEKKEERANTTGQNEFPFDGFTVIFNHEADRIQVKHDVKPPAEMIYSFKRNGFRWSPSFGAWQRQLNNNGISAANHLLNIKLNCL